VGEYAYTYGAPKRGTIKRVGNREVSKIARIAGAPDAAGAGVFLFKKVGDKVKKRDSLLRIFSASKEKLKYAKKTFEENNPYIIK